jgi:hypothetical protein
MSMNEPSWKSSTTRPSWGTGSASAGAEARQLLRLTKEPGEVLDDLVPGGNASLELEASMARKDNKRTSDDASCEQHV